MESSRSAAGSALTAALERGDVTAAGTCYADDARLLAPASGLIQGRKAIEEYWATGISLGLSSMRFEARCVERLGARRIEIGRYRVVIEPDPAHATVEHGLYVVLDQRAADGTWQCAVGVLTPDEPESSSPHRQQGEVK